MLETVWCAVNRVTRQGRVLGREERVDVRTALEAGDGPRCIPVF